MERRTVFALAGVGALLAVTMPLARAGVHGGGGDKHGIKRTLLISIDGMHALDFHNCANGISTVNGGAPYCPALAALAKNGVNYINTSTSKPSDSFPGLTAIVSGASPRTAGANYDVAYDRALNPPQNTTGNGLLGTGPVPTGCTPGATPMGTSTEYEEGIDIDQSYLNGGAPSGDGGVNSIEPTRLERDKNCNPVYPWNFIRINSIFGVIHGAGGYTAWSTSTLLTRRSLDLRGPLQHRTWMTSLDRRLIPIPPTIWTRLRALFPL